MGSRLLVLAVVAMIAAGCGDEPAPTTSSVAAFPPVVVDAWLDALVAGDAPAATRSVEPVGASFVVAIENGLSDDQLVELIESGWPPELARSFWESFRTEFAAFAGARVEEVTVGRHEPMDVGGQSFAVVRVDVAGTEGLVITRMTADGAWVVDLLATLGGAFAPLVFDRSLELGDGPAAGYVRDRLVDTVLPGLDAAVIAFPDDVRLETEVARIRRTIGGS